MKLSLHSGDGQMLGDLNDNFLAENSVSNNVGPYGAKHRITSIFDKTGPYGSAESDQSPFCKTANQPPLIIEDGNKAIAVLTTNPNYETDLPKVSPTELRDFVQGRTGEIITVTL